MNNEMTIRRSTAIDLAEAVKQVKETVKTPLKALANYYSRVLEEEISVKQTARLLTAQVAFLCAVLPADMPFAMRAACVAWLVVSIKTWR